MAKSLAIFYMFAISDARGFTGRESVSAPDAHYRENIYSSHLKDLAHRPGPSGAD